MVPEAAAAGAGPSNYEEYGGAHRRRMRRRWRAEAQQEQRQKQRQPRQEGALGTRKRKAGDALGRDEAAGPAAKKQQPLGLSSITSTLLGFIPPFKEMLQSRRRGRGVEAATAEDPTPPLCHDTAAPQEDSDTDEEPLVTLEEVVDDVFFSDTDGSEELSDVEEEEEEEEEEVEEPLLEAVGDAALPEAEEEPSSQVEEPVLEPGVERAAFQALPEAEEELTTAATAAAVFDAPAAFTRPSARYSPPLVKAVKAVKRSELKRQLKLRAPQRQETTASAAVAVAPSLAGTNSRGARLLSLTVHAALAPYSAAVSIQRAVKEATLDAVAMKSQEAAPAAIAVEGVELGSTAVVQQPVVPHNTPDLTPEGADQARAAAAAAAAAATEGVAAREEEGQEELEMEEEPATEVKTAAPLKAAAALTPPPQAEDQGALLLLSGEPVSNKQTSLLPEDTQFTPLPQLLAGAYLSPSLGGFSFLPKGLELDWESSPGGSGAAAARRLPPASLNKAAGEDEPRRVRFSGVGVEEEEPVSPLEDGESGKSGAVAAPSPAAASGFRLPLPLRGSSRRHHLRTQLPRFGIGAFVQRLPSGVSSLMRGGTTTAAQQGFDAAGEDGDSEEGLEGAPPVVIARRMQHNGPKRRAQALQASAPRTSTPSGAEAVPQALREAFLNARLAESWRGGDAWARLDLAGVELGPGGGREQQLDHAIAAFTCQRGESAVEAALGQLQAEWDHLKAFRQRYVSPLGRGILKHASGVSPLPPSPEPHGADAVEGTPQVGPHSIRDFEAILAADIVATSPPENAMWACPGAAGQDQRGVSALDLTPGIGKIRSRGIKMLSASLQPVVVGPPAATTTTPPSDAKQAAVGAPVPRAHVHSSSQQKLAAEGRVGSSGRPAPRGGSRGQKLLQALQNAAGGPPPTAAAAGLIFVDGACGDVAELVSAGPMATSFTTRD